MCVNPIFLDKAGTFVPCRKCSECRLQRARDWAVRCYFESLTHEDNCFVTLTYAPDFNPGVLLKSELQKFIKRLRSRFPGVSIKYFACGEYGSRTFRPHFHINLFGVNLCEIPFSRSKKNKVIFHSNLLDSLWPVGLHSVQELNFNTAVYSALYSAKSKKKLPARLLDYPEFNLMSHGIGIQEIEKKISTYFTTDEIYIDGNRFRIPEAVLRDLWVHKDSYGNLVKDLPYEVLKVRRSERALNNETILEKNFKAAEKFQLTHLPIAWSIKAINDYKQYRDKCFDRELKKNSLPFNETLD